MFFRLTGNSELSAERDGLQAIGWTDTADMATQMHNVTSLFGSAGLLKRL